MLHHFYSITKLFFALGSDYQYSLVPRWDGCFFRFAATFYFPELPLHGIGWDGFVGQQSSVCSFVVTGLFVRKRR